MNLRDFLELNYQDWRQITGSIAMFFEHNIYTGDLSCVQTSQVSRRIRQLETVKYPFIFRKRFVSVPTIFFVSSDIYYSNIYFGFRY